MPDFTLYVASIDVAFWGTMFNIVAMICQQDTFIFGFAALASSFLLFKGQAAASVNAANGSMSTVLANNAVGSIIPFIVAMTLTSTAFQSKVSIESTTSGRVTVVANVPVVISALPSAASIIMHELQGYVRTGFLVAGTNYQDISAMDNGFINPLKVLLTARAAVPRLGYIDSDVNAVVSSCLGPESRVDFGQVNALVLNAGNGGTGTSQGATIAQTVPINGVLGTSLGALLYQASLQTNTFVADITDSTGAILSCPDAVAVVQGRISNSLQSSDFARITVGAVNGMDDPTPGAGFDINKLSASYAAYRNANAVVSVAGVGSTAAAAETINLLMVDVVNNNLNCLKASSSDKTQCYAAMIQASETERTNLARVAEAVPALQYAGAFFNDLLALIIVLGPIIVMFMMFAGQDMGRPIKALAHIMVWPMLCMGVGSEAINGMLAIHTSNFLTSISNGGYLSQSQALEVYKHFAMEIGSASSMMASLPSIMSIIFALGGASALAHHVPAAKAGDGVKDNIAPRVANDAPILQKSSMAVGEMGSNFANIRHTGATRALSATARYGDMAVTAQRGLQEATSHVHAVSAGKADLATWQQAFRSHNYSAVGVDAATGERIRKSYDESVRRNEGTRIHEGQEATRSNSNDTNANIKGGVGVSAGGGGGKPIGVKGSVNLGAGTSTNANDSLRATQGGGTSKDINESQALSNAISQEKANTKNVSHGSRTEKALDRSLSTQRDFRDNVTKSDSSTDTYSNLATQSSGILMANAAIGYAEFGQQMNANGAFRMYNAVKGKAMESNPTFRKHMADAEAASNDGSTDSLLADNETRAAAFRMRAATRMALDPASTEDEKRMALEYATGAAGALTGLNTTAGSVKPIGLKIADPVNETGVDSQKLVDKVNGGTPKGPPQKPTGTHTPTHHPMVRPSNPAHKQAPKEASEMDKLGEELRKKETSGVSGVDIKLENARQKEQAHRAGLNGPDAPGTAHRTASNVVKNFQGNDHVSLDKNPRQASGRIVDE